MTSDSLSIVLLCLGIVLLPIIAVLAVWGHGRWTRRGSTLVIPMDGANFLRMNDGTLQIRPTRLMNFVILVIILFFDVALVLLVISLVVNLVTGKTAVSETPQNWIAVPFVVAFLSGATVVLLRSLRSTSVTIDPAQRAVLSGSAGAPKTTPFNQLRSLQVGFDPTAAIDRNTVALIPLTLVTSSGENIALGNLSGAAKRTQEHALELARVVRSTINTSGDSRLAALTSDGQEIAS